MRMKSVFVLLMGLFSLQLGAQITQDASYAYSGTFTQLAVSGDKFYVMDVTNSQCRIYNTNHSLWKTINLEIPSGQYLYDIQYISENLFTSNNDLSLIYTYYLYDEVNQFYTYTTKVIKEDGSLLLNLPGCQYYFVTTLQDGSTKLVTYSYDYSVWPSTITTAVYSLPGTLLSQHELASPVHANNLAAFPNPASDHVNLVLSEAVSSSDALLQMHNSTGQLVLQKPLQAGQKQFQLHVGQYPKGIYLYEVKDGNRATVAQKLIIQ